MRKKGVGFLFVILCLAALPAQPDSWPSSETFGTRSIGQAAAERAAADFSFPQLEILHASDAQIDDAFGFAVAISGDTAVVGAYEEAGGSGDPLTMAGAAYVFRRQVASGPWSQVARLTATVPQDGAAFGFSVAISGDIALVGAPWEDSGGGTIIDTGAAYLFGRNQGGADNWGEIKRLAAPDAQTLDDFGYSVSISGQTAVIGARGEDGGIGDPEGGAGAAYVFQQIDTFPWNDVATLRASDTQSNDSFGSSVALDGDFAVVGALFEDGGPSDPKIAAGAAYLFDRDSGGSNQWGEVKKLIASDAQTNDQYGGSVAISGDTIIIGARNEDGGPLDLAADAGAAYITQYISGFGWFEIEKLMARESRADDEFGGSVAISGDTAIVGSRYHDGGFPFGKGAAYVFIRHLTGANNWGEAKELTASDAKAGDWFGGAVSISGDHAIIGAFEADGGPGDPFSGAGAAYVFRMGFLGTFQAEAPSSESPDPLRGKCPESH